MTEFGPHSRAAAQEGDEQRKKLSREVSSMESSIQEGDFDLADLANPDIDFHEEDIKENLEQETLLITKSELEEQILDKEKEEKELKKKYNDSSETLTVVENIKDKKSGQENQEEVKVKEKAREAWEKSNKELLGLKERKSHLDNMTNKSRRHDSRLLRVKDRHDEAEKRDIREAEDRLNEITDAKLAQEASPEKLR